MNWETWQRAIELDGGSLWDVYVLRADRRDWQQFLDWLRRSGLPLSLTRNGTPEEVPEDVGDIFAEQDAGGACTLFIDPEGMRVNTHFFSEDEIEFDIGPREVRTTEELVRLQRLLTDIATLLGKPVLVTPENGQELPWFKIEPDGTTRSFLE